MESIQASSPQWHLQTKVAIARPLSAMGEGFEGWYRASHTITHFADARRRHYSATYCPEDVIVPHRRAPQVLPRIELPPSGLRKLNPLLSEVNTSTNRGHVKQPISVVDERVFSQSKNRVISDGVRQSDRKSNERSLETEMTRKIRTTEIVLTSAQRNLERESITHFDAHSTVTKDHDLKDKQKFDRSFAKLKSDADLQAQSASSKSFSSPKTTKRITALTADEVQQRRIPFYQKQLAAVAATAKKEVSVLPKYPSNKQIVS